MQFGAEDSSGAREFAQVLRTLPLTALPRRFFRDEAFQAFYTKLGQLSEGPSRDRIARSLRLFRRSLSDPDPIDVFEDTWGALEALNHLLQKKHNLPTTVPGTPCKQCGAKTEVTGSSSGIKHALVDLAGSSVWQQARTLRTDIAHSIESHDSIIKRIPGVLPELRRAVAAAMLDLLGVADADLADFSRLPMNPKVPAQSFLAARLRGWKAPSSIEVEHLPFIEVTVTERERTGDFGAPGKKTVVFNLAYTPRNLTGSMEACSVEVFVTKDPEDKSATMALSDFQIQRQHAKDL